MSSELFSISDIVIGNAERISSRNSKGLCDEIIKPPNTSDDSFAPVLS